MPTDPAHLDIWPPASTRVERAEATADEARALGVALDAERHGHGVWASYKAALDAPDQRLLDERVPRAN